jgi:hypothetical protein
VPTIAVFYGIVIQMFHRDHPPAHIHVKYQGHEGWVTIADGELLRGHLPLTARRLVKRWVLRYKEELGDNWQRGRRLEPLQRIPGLDDDEDHLG